MVRGKGDIAFERIVYVILFLVLVICLFPILYVITVSITPLKDIVKNGGFSIFPRNITLAAYKEILEHPKLIPSMQITFWSTVVGTIVTMTLSVFLAYGLSKKDLPGRKVFIFLMMFTMMFGGGTIPTYILIRNLHLIDSFWALILPGCISTYNVVLMKNFYENMPDELFESASIDGAGQFTILKKIVMPLSKPVFMTVALFTIVGYWNSYFPSIMYFTDSAKQTLQVILRELLGANLTGVKGDIADEIVNPVTFQMACVVFATFPIVLVYPFIQKHFAKGMMLGAVKG